MLAKEKMKEMLAKEKKKRKIRRKLDPTCAGVESLLAPTHQRAHREPRSGLSDASASPPCFG